MFFRFRRARKHYIILSFGHSDINVMTSPVIATVCVITTELTTTGQAPIFYFHYYYNYYYDNNDRNRSAA